VRILDLCSYKTLPWPVPERINPFTTETLLEDLEINELLTAFADEMARPLERDDDDSRYEPCLRLAAVVKGAGFDGIRYPSALGDGTNLVFFDPQVASIADARLISVTATEITYVAEETASDGFYEIVRSCLPTFYRTIAFDFVDSADPYVQFVAHDDDGRLKVFRLRHRTNIGSAQLVLVRVGGEAEIGIGSIDLPRTSEGASFRDKTEIDQECERLLALAMDE